MTGLMAVTAVQLAAVSEGGQTGCGGACGAKNRISLPRADAVEPVCQCAQQASVDCHRLVPLVEDGGGVLALSASPA